MGFVKCITCGEVTSSARRDSRIAYGWDARGNLAHDGVFTYTYPMKRGLRNTRRADGGARFNLGERGDN
jgi:hypothetical protein